MTAHRPSTPKRWQKPAVFAAVLTVAATAGVTLAVAHTGATPAKVVGSPTAGKPLFTLNCAGCHTLAAANAKGTVGPNLDLVSLTEATIVKAITNGGATVMTKAQVAKYAAKMPAYKSILTATKIQNIAAFVYTAMNESKTVKVSLTKTKITISPTKIQPGKITFAVHNGTTAVRNFSINGKDTAEIKPGKTASLAATFTKAGKYPYSSVVAGSKVGIKGTFVVVAPPTASTTTTTSTPPPATTAATTTTSAPPTTSTPAGPPYNESDPACPPGKTIVTAGGGDADGDEQAQEPNDNDGCL
jgi:mono/diheme cytochrome c family protein